MLLPRGKQSLGFVFDLAFPFAVFSLSLSSFAPPCTKLQKSISVTPAIFFFLIA